MGPSPSWTLLLNQWLMVLCPSLYTGNPHIQTTIYSGTVTITSQPSLVSSKPSPMGPPLCAAILSCFKKKRITSGKLSPNAITPNGPWTRCRKDSTSLPGQVNDGGNNTAQSANQEVQSKGHIVIPYTQGLCESIKRICGRYGIQTHFKGGRTIKNLLVSPKDKDPIVNQSGAIYRYQCGDLDCDDEYIGETSRTFGERYKEHLKAPSAIHHHSIQTGHPTNQNNFQIVGREGHNLARNIKESIYIRVNNPSLNNNIGKFNLSHIWDRVLLNTKGLTL